MTTSMVLLNSLSEWHQQTPLLATNSNTERSLARSSRTMSTITASSLVIPFLCIDFSSRLMELWSGTGRKIELCSVVPPQLLVLLPHLSHPLLACSLSEAPTCIG